MCDWQVNDIWPSRDTCEACFMGVTYRTSFVGDMRWYHRIESTQRFACRVILQQWKLSHDELLQESDLPTLVKRRDVATLCHLFKIFHGLCSSPNPYRPHPHPSLRHLNSCAVVDPPFCRLSLSKSSFYPYAPTLWNYLPEAVVESTSLQAFKLAVHSHLL